MQVSCIHRPFHKDLCTRMTQVWVDFPVPLVYLFRLGPTCLDFANPILLDSTGSPATVELSGTFWMSAVLLLHWLGVVIPIRMMTSGRIGQWSGCSTCSGICLGYPLFGHHKVLEGTSLRPSKYCPWNFQNVWTHPEHQDCPFERVRMLSFFPDQTRQM